MRSIAGGIGTPGGEGVAYSPKFAADLGHGAGEGGDQHQALAIRFGGDELGLGGGDVGLRGVAGGAARAGLGARLFLGAGGDEAALDQLRLTRGLALGVGRHRAHLVHALARGGELGAGDRRARVEVAMPQSHQHLPGLDAVAFLHPQPLDAPAGDGRHLRALAGLDLAGAGVGQRGLDGAAGHLMHHHLDRLRAG
jgi:hypothetical protein